MPSVGTVLSGGVTIGVLAGVFSGICYLLVLGLRWAGKLHATVQERNEARQLNQNIKSCARCGRQLSLLALGRGRRIQCVQCKLIVCRYCCCRTNNSKWLCTTCKKHRDIQLQSGEWFYQQVCQRFHSTVAAIANTDNKDGEVRQFVEKLVETLLGGSLDHVPLGPLSSDPKYKFLPGGEVPSAIRAELTELIKQIVQKAKSLPRLQDGGYTSHIPSFNGNTDDLTSKSYEDILATAILNKVITSYQVKKHKANYKREFCDEDSHVSLNHSSRETESMDNEKNESETEDSDSCANSHYYYSWSESGHDPLSVMIEECIEEVTTRYSSDDEEVPISEKDNLFSTLKIMHRQRAPFPELGKDIVDAGGTESSSEGNENEESEIKISHGMELVNPIDSWEENWLFQRRTLKASSGTCQPVPVPMLVPLPSHDYRALIGDIDADETSDLSECSDSALEDLIDGSCNKKHSYTSCASDSEDEIMRKKHKEVFLDYMNGDFRDIFYNDVAPQAEEIFSSDSKQSVHNESKQHTDTSISASYEEVPANHCNTSETVLDENEITDKTFVSNIVGESINEATNEELIHSTSGEGSLEIQQDSEYTVAYAVPAQLEPEADEISVKPVPKPRTLLNELEEISYDNIDKFVKRLEVSELATPPKPGTIAEREHLKWQQAPPLPNNPYSKENIEHRKHRNIELINIHSDNEASVDFPELNGTKEPSLIKIDSKGYTKKSYKKYGRDYYINTEEENEAENEKDNKSSAKEKEMKPQQPQQNLETKQQVSVRVEVEVARWCGSSTEKLPKPSVQTQTEISSSKQNTLPVPKWTDTITDNDFCISLPSVKELAKHFQSQNETEQEVKHTSNKVLTHKKENQTTQQSPTHQVHSLTARSISREFREGLRGVNSASKFENNEQASVLNQQTYENEVVLSTSTSTTTTPQQKKLKNNIEFWEKMNFCR